MSDICEFIKKYGKPVPNTKERIKFRKEYLNQINPVIEKFQSRFKTSNPPTNEECSVFIDKMDKKISKLKLQCGLT